MMATGIGLRTKLLACVAAALGAGCPAPNICSVSDAEALAEAVEATCSTILITSSNLRTLAGLEPLARRADLLVMRNDALVSVEHIARVDGAVRFSSNRLLRDASFGAVSGTVSVGLDETAPVLERLAYELFESDDPQVLTALRIESPRPLALRQISIGCESFCVLRDVLILAPAFAPTDVRIEGIEVQNLVVAYVPEDLEARVVDDFGVPTTSVIISGAFSDALRDAYRAWLEAAGFAGTFRACPERSDECEVVLSP